MPAKTTAQRQAEFVKRQKNAGLKKVTGLWAYPEDHAAIRWEAAERTKAREMQKTRDDVSRETSKP